MQEWWKNLSGPCKGILLMIVGAILLLHTFGVLKEGLGIIITIVSAIMIIYGFVLCDGHTLIMKLLKRKKEPESESEPEH